jgi:hypothetical protein
MWPLPGRHDDYAAKNRFAFGGFAMPDQLNALYSEFLEGGYD